MPLHPQAEQFLAQLKTQRHLPLETLPVEMSRQALLLGSGLCRGCPTLARLEDRHIPGPGGPLRIRLYTPKAQGPLGVCLYFHGGGWVLNSIETHDDLVRRLTAAGNCLFVSVDYRLAPEHPFPAAIDDGYAALLWVAEHASEWGGDPARIAVAGDSAGGNIAAVLCLMSRDRSGPPIRQQTLIYPITDCDFNRPSYLANADGYFLTRSQMQWFWDQYVPDPAQRSDPYASPLRAASLAGLPPALVLTAEYDPLRDEGEAFAAALRAAGVPVKLHRYDGMIHAFVKRVEIFNAAHDAIARIGAELQQALAPSG
jgi:acetyl esterase